LHARWGPGGFSPTQSMGLGNDMPHVGGVHARLFFSRKNQAVLFFSARTAARVGNMGLVLVLGIWAGLFGSARIRHENINPKHGRHKIIWAGLAQSEGGLGPGLNFRPVGPPTRPA
jgi:hypothetical protein